MYGTSEGKTRRGEHNLREGGCIVYKLHCTHGEKREACDAILVVQEMRRDCVDTKTRNDLQ